VESQAETTDGQQAKIEEIAAVVGAKPDPEKDKPKPKGKAKAKKKAKEPSKEEIQSAVAGVVLAEMKFWPESIVSLIGEQHPNKESFLKGVAYVIGGYMHFARKALEGLVTSRKKEAEQKTCGLLTPVINELTGIRTEWQKGRTDAIGELKRQRAAELKAAKDAINKKYDEKEAEVTSQPFPERGQELIEREATIKSAFEGACGTIDAEAKELRTQIEEIEEARDSWNSKKRKARRLAAEPTKDDAQEAPEAVE
jgi:hypothetical protein